MPRPKKHTIDYFPHDCSASMGGTLFILQARFGNDGYAAWFKLLELVGKEGDFQYNISDPLRFEYLASYWRVDETRCRDILECMAKVKAIDSELYTIGIIWIDNLLERLAPLYQRRKGDLPKKPSFHILKQSAKTEFMSTETPLEGSLCQQKPPLKGVIDDIYPQSKVKESKVKEKKKHIPALFTKCFDRFWEKYPARNGAKIGKAETLKKFSLLTEQQQEEAIQAAINYSTSTQYPVDPVRFFKSREYPNGLWREWVNVTIEGQEDPWQKALREERERGTHDKHDSV